MNPANHRHGLAAQNARLLVWVFLILELLIAVLVVVFLMAPMARRSANDLAALMFLSAQTWSELPPETRPAFEYELATKHALALRADPPAGARDEWHGPYLHFLEAALAARTGQLNHLAEETIAGEEWFWAALPSGRHMIAVGFPASRIETHPLLALIASSAVGLILALLAARWLARQTVAPLTRLERAISRVGMGQTPALLDETGPAELATLASRFNTMARQVQELLAARTTLLAGLSHDLRTPLARMRLAVSLLEERPSAKTLARLEQDIVEMDELIGDILDLARGMEGEPAVAIELSGLLDELAGRSGHPERISVHGLPLTVEEPERALHRALGNLLENALRHGSNQLVEIVVESSPAETRIGILDRGPGIPPDKLEAVFEPFYRLDSSRSPATGGAGLGLAIVRQLATANGWRIELQSRPDGGLQAWLVLADRRAARMADSSDQPDLPEAGKP